MTQNSPGIRWLASLAAACLACAWGGPARAQRADEKVSELEGVEVVEHLGARLPVGLDFLDEDGKPVKLGDYFDGRTPVILTLNYYRCPMLCTLQLNGFVDGLRRMPWTPGKEFRVVTISIDPKETPDLARLKKQNYMNDYGRAGAAAGWAFLTGRDENIQAVASAVGFKYRYDKATDQYAHAAAMFVCMPDGRVARYLYGVLYDPQTLRLSLVEASEGKTASTVDRVLLWCFHYDATKGKYAPKAMRVMQAGGSLTAIVLAAVLGALWRRDARKRRASALAEGTSSEGKTPS